MDKTKPVLIQYTMTFEHADSLPAEVVAAINRKDGSFCPMVTQSWDYTADHTRACAKGYRPAEIEPGRGGRCRRGDWVVVDSHTFEATDPNAPYRAIVICTVEYRPVSDPQWKPVGKLKIPPELEAELT